MVILFEENETEFANLGLGVLKDVISCYVQEKLNDEFTLEMTYPILGRHFKELRIGRCIGTKSNPYSDSIQPFRIYSITKPINGIVTVNANHISYDMNGIPVNAIDGKNLQDAISQIQNGAFIKHNFVFVSDVESSKKFKTTSPYNMRALIMGSEDAILDVYNAEVEFDKFLVNIKSKRGHDRGAKVIYASNMTDLEHETNDDLLYNGVFPYYHTEETSTETEIDAGEFTKGYIVGSKPRQANWLAYTENGEAFTPVEGAAPIQIKTEGEYYEKVYVWNEARGVYVEKMYNQQVTLIEGITSPTWISIDWSQFPKVICKAAKAGYFKTMTDEDWGEIRGVGDVIFEGNLLTGGVTSMISNNMILYYSEVIPSNNDKMNEEVTKVVDVQLDDKIIWLETSDATNMKYNKILSLDLTQEFEEEPTKEKLRSKAEEYISKNKVGTVRHTTSVSFIDLSKTTEGRKYEQFDKIELGDTVNVKYEDLGVNVDLRVITTKYDAVSDVYESIELGEKEDRLSASTIQNGDNISSLSNDVGYADVTTVNKLIAKQVTAEYLEAINAKLSKAQIKQLEAEHINVAGILEASQFTVDKIVASMLIAENAEIAKTLSAGNIKVKGDIDITSGAIKIEDPAKGTTFKVDRQGNVDANSVNIKGGSFNIESKDGGSAFDVTNDGTMTAKNANIEGKITSEEGEIGGFTLAENRLYIGSIGNGVYFSNGFESELEDLTGDKEKRKWAIAVKNKFGVTLDGVFYAKSAVIYGGGTIAGFTIDNNRLYCIDDNFNGYVLLANDEIALGGTVEDPNFRVTSQGDITIKEGSISLCPKKWFREWNVHICSREEDFQYGEDGEGIYNYLKPDDETEGTLWYCIKVIEPEKTQVTTFYRVDKKPTIEEWSKFRIFLLKDLTRVYECLYDYEDNVFSVNDEMVKIGKYFSVDPNSGETKISGFTIIVDEETNQPSFEYESKTEYVHVGPDSISLGKDRYGDPKFIVNNEGTMKTEDTEITGLLKSGDTGYVDEDNNPIYNFVLNNEGTVNIGYDNIYNEYHIILNKDNVKFFKDTILPGYDDYICTISKEEGISILKGSIQLGAKEKQSSISESMSINQINSNIKKETYEVHYIERAESENIRNQYPINKTNQAKPKSAVILDEQSRDIITVDTINSVTEQYKLYYVKRYDTEITVYIVDTVDEVITAYTYYYVKDKQAIYYCDETGTPKIIQEDSDTRLRFNTHEDLVNNIMNLNIGEYYLQTFSEESSYIKMWLIKENSLFMRVLSNPVSMKEQELGVIIANREELESKLLTINKSGYALQYKSESEKDTYIYAWYIYVDRTGTKYAIGYNYFEDDIDPDIQHTGFSYYDGISVRHFSVNEYIYVSEEPNEGEVGKYYILQTTDDKNYSILWMFTKYELKEGYNYVPNSSEGHDLIYNTSEYQVKLILNEDYSIIDSEPDQTKWDGKESGFLYLLNNTYDKIYELTFDSRIRMTGYNYYPLRSGGETVTTSKMTLYRNSIEYPLKEIFELPEQKAETNTYILVDEKPPIEMWREGLIYILNTYDTAWQASYSPAGFQFTVNKEGRIDARSIFVGAIVDPDGETYYPFQSSEENGTFIGGFKVDHTTMTAGDEKSGLRIFLSSTPSGIESSSIGGSQSYLDGWVAIITNSFGIRYDLKTQKSEVYADSMHISNTTVTNLEAESIHNSNNSYNLNEKGLYFYDISGKNITENVSLTKNGGLHFLKATNIKITYGSENTSLLSVTDETITNVIQLNLYLLVRKVSTDKKYYVSIYVRDNKGNIPTQEQLQILRDQEMPFKIIHYWYNWPKGGDELLDLDFKSTGVIKDITNEQSCGVSNSWDDFRPAFGGVLYTRFIDYNSMPYNTERTEFITSISITMPSNNLIKAKLRATLLPPTDSSESTATNNQYSIGDDSKKWYRMRAVYGAFNNNHVSLPAGITSNYINRVLLPENQNDNKLFMKDKNNVEFINIGKFVGVLTNSISELKNEINELKEEIKKLKEAN